MFIGSRVFLNVFFLQRFKSLIYKWGLDLVGFR